MSLESRAEWPEEDRRVIHVTPLLGPEVIERLSEVGIPSLAALRHVGVDRAVELICQRIGSGAWRNRRRALHRALASTGFSGSCSQDGAGDTCMKSDDLKTGFTGQYGQREEGNTCMNSDDLRTSRRTTATS
jgi:hypothetical protein